MCVVNTPVSYHDNLGLYVKHEEQCCPGGPNFSKTRGVFVHVKSRPEPLIGVLDTSHSQGGWAVARACSLLGKQCRLFYPKFKADTSNVLKPQQAAARSLGAELVPITAGRSAILYNRVRKSVDYMMPNALKLPESVAETAAEVARTAIPNDINAVLVSASSGTIAAGVIRGLEDRAVAIIVHLGYSRPIDPLRRYLAKMVGWDAGPTIIDEEYEYKDVAHSDFTPPDFPCNQHYDLKAWRWWVREGQDRYGKALFWNIG